MKKRMKYLKNKLLNNVFSKIFSTVVLFLVSGAAFADASFVSGTPAWVTASDPVANHTDLSIAYLAQVFGTVGSSLQGTTGQMLGMIISKFNVGVLVVSAVWLMFTIVTICIRAATSGSFMGQNKNVFWVLLRIALAFALLLPGPATGYNLIQDMVMKIVVEGVSLADQTWSYGLGYIQDGGSLWRPPESTSNKGGQAIVSTQQATDIMGAGTTGSYNPPDLNSTDIGLQIFINEVCMVSSSIANMSAVNSSGGSGVANSSPQPVQYNIIDDDTNYRFAFPGYGNKGSNYAEQILNDPTNNHPSCGDVYWGNPPVLDGTSQSSKQGGGLGIVGANCNIPADNSDYAGTSSANHCLMAKAAVGQMVYGLLPAAKNYACSQPNAQGLAMCAATPPSTSLNATNQNMAFSSLINYVNGVTPVAQSQQLPETKSGSDSQQKALSFITEAQKAGWMMAGRYYWDLASIQAHMKSISDISKYVPSIHIMNGFPSSDCDSGASSSVPTQVCRAVIGAPSTWATYMNGNTSSVIPLLNNYQQASGAGSTGQPAMPGSKISGNAALTLVLGPIVSDVVRLCQMFNTNQMGTDPILFLHNIGMQCIAVAGDIWLSVALALFAIAIGTMFCNATANAWTPVSAVSDWLKPILMVVALAFLGVGVLFGYFVPIYPFAVFIFGVISWIISVIEAMVAAPLVAFGLTHPEGHDFLGGAKQGLMLLLSVFLRPVLMVIGLIAGMILSYVSLRILLFAYSGFLSDVFYTGGPSSSISPGDLWAGASATANNLAMDQLNKGSIGGVMMLLFCFPLLLGVFASLVYIVTGQCFSLIYALPDYVMRWIGVTPSANNSAQMAQQLQGHTGGIGKTIGSGIKASSETLDKLTSEKEAKEKRGGGDGATSIDT